MLLSAVGAGAGEWWGGVSLVLAIALRIAIGARAVIVYDAGEEILAPTGEFMHGFLGRAVFARAFCGGCIGGGCGGGCRVV